MQFSLREKYMWFDILFTLISNYNDTKHRTIVNKPKDVTPEDVNILKDRSLKTHYHQTLSKDTCFCPHLPQNYICKL